MIDGSPASPEISLTVWWLFLTQQQRLNCVDVIISTCTASDACRLFQTSTAACWCCSSLKLCSEDLLQTVEHLYKSFTFTEIFDQNFASFTEQHQPPKLLRLLDIASKFALFLVSGLKDEKLIKKQTYTKTETCKLYSRDFWILLPNIIKIDPT